MYRILMLFILLLTLTGCGRIPEPVGYNYSQQQKMQAVSHWQILAADVASRINTELIIGNRMDKTVFVKATCGSEDMPCENNQTSSFNEAFRDLLITELVANGVPVEQQADADAITVHYKVQVVRHDSERLRPVRPGLITGLTTAIMVLRDAPHQLLTMAAAGAADFTNQALVLNGRYEVVITTSMVENTRYTFRNSDIYYINDRDFLQYRETTARATEIPLSSSH